MSIHNRWLDFVNSIVERRERDDPQGALLFKKTNEANIPPDEASLEWGIAYVNAQQAMIELMTVCTKQGRVDDVYIIGYYILELNETLSERRNTIQMPKEFVKEAKF